MASHPSNNKSAKDRRNARLPLVSHLRLERRMPFRQIAAEVERQLGVFGNGRSDQDRLGFARQRMAGRSREQHTAGVRRGADGVRPRYCGAMAAVRSQQAETSCQAGKGSHGTRRYKHVRKPCRRQASRRPRSARIGNVECHGGTRRRRANPRRNPQMGGTPRQTARPRQGTGRHHIGRKGIQGLFVGATRHAGIDEIVRRIDEERERKLSEEDE